MEFLLQKIGDMNVNAEVFGNTLYDYGQALAAFVVLVAVLKIIQWVLLRRFTKFAEKTKTDIDDTFIAIIKSLKPAFYYFVALYFALQFLTLVVLVEKVISGVIIAWMVYQVVIAMHILVDYIFDKRVGREEAVETKSAIRFLGRLIKWFVWAIAVLLVLSNFGVNITSLIAGLGIGGIAIAFALQSILGDLFSSFAIYFDKPFVVGDFIIVGEHKGTVEKIGIKATRLRALQGEEIVISNQELTSTRIQNFKQMRERRISFGFGVLYETPTEKLKKIPNMVKDIFKQHDNARLDRVHFKSFGDSSLDFEVIYYVQSGDYTQYMDVQQAINLKLKERFEEENIGFAYPTRTVYLAKG